MDFKAAGEGLMDFRSVSELVSEIRSIKERMRDLTSEIAATRANAQAIAERYRASIERREELEAENRRLREMLAEKST